MQLQEKQKLLEELCLQNNADCITSIKELKDDISNLIHQDKLFWRKRSQSIWLPAGDKNTKHFHNQASQRRHKNHIHGVFDEEGRWCNTKDGIARVAESYFKDLFVETPAVNIEGVVQAVERRVTPQMNDRLTQRYSPDEVRTALFQMHPSKALGPDGMSPFFFQKYWHIVGHDVTEAVLSVLHSSHMLKKMNRTHIVPKKKDPTHLVDYRLISLSNVVSQIISKVIANRLKYIFPNVVSESQSTFMPNRFITDNITVAYKLLHRMRNRRRGKVGHMAVKLDISKAYDRVDWNFLQNIMCKLRFDQRWVHVVIETVTTASYSIVINGEPKGFITQSRGIRQGDPLSPYLFLLCAEGLLALLRKDVETRVLHGVLSSQHGVCISHLLFADDSLLFCKATVGECQQLLHILGQYEEASG